LYIGEVFWLFLRLGLTSFGGPVAHLGIFRRVLVSERKWVSDAAYADIVALCQFLPGPASSQVGMALGLTRAGWGGALAAWLGFTLPSALALTLFAECYESLNGLLGGNWLHGLKLAAVAVIAQALLGMARSLCPDARRATIAVAALALSFLIAGPSGQIMVIIAGGMAGLFLLPPESAEAELDHQPLTLGISRRTGALLLVIFAALLVLLPLASRWSGLYAVQAFEAFYRTGALVFGGGHVVLPLLQDATVSPGWVSPDAFLAGYGAAQAVPGPLFTFAAYLGAVSHLSPNGFVGAALATVAIFLPSFLLVVGGLPFWAQMRRHQSLRRALRGINAAVVGLLLAAFYDPAWTGSIHSGLDFALAALAFVLLTLWKVPPWLVVLLAALTPLATSHLA